MSKADAYSFEITTSQLCNLACNYCFEDSAEGDIKVKGKNTDIPTELIIKKIYDLLASEEIINEYKGNVHVVFWGGEPTTNTQLILDILEEFCENEHITFFLYTNGYIMKPYLKMAAILKNCTYGMGRFKIQVSYDGMAIGKKHRVTHGGRSTSEKVRANVDELYKLGFATCLKATLPILSVADLVETWQEHADMEDHYRDIPGHVGATFRFCPTIDYSHGNTDDVDTELWLSQVREIAKREIAYFKKHGYFIWTWFDDVSPIRCGYTSYGSTMNVNGDMYKCHGEFYHNEKDVDVVTTIDSDTFVEDLIDMSKKMQKLNSKDYTESTPCDTCVATHCQQCNSVKRTFSNKPTFEEQWKDFTNQPVLCTLYKMFGATSRAMQKILEK